MFPPIQEGKSYLVEHRRSITYTIPRRSVAGCGAETTRKEHLESMPGVNGVHLQLEVKAPFSSEHSEGTALAIVASAVRAAHHITPGCRLRSLRSLRPTLARSRHLLRAKAQMPRPGLRVRQPGAVIRNCGKNERRPVLGRLEKPGWCGKALKKKGVLLVVG